MYNNIILTRKNIYVKYSGPRSMSLEPLGYCITAYLYDILKSMLLPTVVCYEM